MLNYYVAEYGYSGERLSGELTIDRVGPITAEEYGQVLSLFDFTSDYVRIKYIKQMTVESGHDFIDYCHNLKTIKKDFDILNSDAYGVTGNKLLITFLSFIRIFQDVIQNTLAKREDERFDDYKDFNTLMYDDYLGYRLCTRMRNYVTHFDVPLTSINNSLEGGISLTCHKEQLLQYDGWSSVKKEIEHLPSEFEMNEYVGESIVAIEALYLKALENYFEEAYSCYNKFQKWQSEHHVDRAIIVSIDDETEEKVSLHPFPVNTMIEFFKELSKHPNYDINISEKDEINQ